MGFNDLQDAAPIETFTYLVKQLSPSGLAYLHVATSRSAHDYHAALRPLFSGTYLLGGGLTRESAEQRIALGQADAAVFGSAFLANPDLPQRLLADAPLNKPNPRRLHRLPNACRKQLEPGLARACLWRERALQQGTLPTSVVMHIPWCKAAKSSQGS
ncbi:hypothetical protein ACIPF8_23270 [Collimonas sp. NPDC087041]|uniref:hypothetical protein n=1 Tax=Collimonas sp. NPDC087041 TaxID=3363960 RepID=UPI00382BCF96